MHIGRYISKSLVFVAEILCRVDLCGVFASVSSFFDDTMSGSTSRANSRRNDHVLSHSLCNYVVTGTCHLVGRLMNQSSSPLLVAKGGFVEPTSNLGTSHAIKRPVLVSVEGHFGKSWSSFFCVGECWIGTGDLKGTRVELFNRF